MRYFSSLSYFYSFGREEDPDGNAAIVFDKLRIWEMFNEIRKHFGAERFESVGARSKNKSDTFSRKRIVSGIHKIYFVDDEDRESYSVSFATQKYTKVSVTLTARKLYFRMTHNEVMVDSNVADIREFAAYCLDGAQIVKSSEVINRSKTEEEGKDP